jgi:hypothetical protein
MSEVKTVTHEGKVYQIGKVYSFGEKKALHKLSGISIDSDLPFRVQLEDGEYGYKRINLSNEEFGTITPAPVEYIDNAPYMFEVGGSKFLGFYEASQEAFFDNDEGGDEVAKLSDCTNIRPMTVGSE